MRTIIGLTAKADLSGARYKRSIQTWPLWSSRFSGQHHNKAGLCSPFAPIIVRRPRGFPKPLNLNEKECRVDDLICGRIGCGRGARRDWATFLWTRTRSPTCHYLLLAFAQQAYGASLGRQQEPPARIGSHPLQQIAVSAAARHPNIKNAIATQYNQLAESFAGLLFLASGCLLAQICHAA